MYDGCRTALIYVRKSVVRQKTDEISPERQRAACVAYCEARGWRYEIFEDAEGHRSGRSEERRPEWKRLKAQIGRQDVVAVVVNSLDRSSRSPADFFRFLDELQRAGVELVSVTEQFDTTTAIGRAFLAILMVIAGLEAEMASERVSATIAYRKARGQTWGNAPFGYTRSSDDGMLLRPNEDAGVIRKVFEVFLQEQTFGRTAKALNGLGLRFRKRSRRSSDGSLISGRQVLFCKDSVRSVISNVLVYAGYQAGGHAKDYPTAPTLAKLIDLTGAARTGHTPLIDHDMADAVLAVRSSRHEKRVRGSARVYPLQSVLRCDHCGASLRGAVNHGRPVYRHYPGQACEVCGMFAADQLEAGVFNLLAGIEFPSELLTDIRRAALERVNQGDDATEIMAQMARLRGRLDRSRLLFLEGDMTKAEYDAIRAEVHERIEEFEGQVQDQDYDVDVLSARLADLAGTVAGAAPVQQRRVVAALFDEIRVGVGGEIKAVSVAGWLRPLVMDLSRAIELRPMVPPRDLSATICRFVSLAV